VQNSVDQVKDYGKDGTINQLPRIAILLVKAFIYRFLTIDNQHGPTPISQILTTIKRGIFAGLKFYMTEFGTPGLGEDGKPVNPIIDEATRNNCNQMHQIC